MPCSSDVQCGCPASVYEGDSFVSKGLLRKDILSKRSALSSAEAARLSNSIQRRVLEEPRWHEASLVALYVAVRNEVATDALLNAAWTAGKTVLLPRCLPRQQGESLMEFAACRGREELIPGAFGLLEPGPMCPAWPELYPSGKEHSAVDAGIPVRYPDVMLVPALGISPTGARTGYGKGYYDRLLARPGWKDVPRAALIYRFQLVTFASSPLDMPMHGYFTEEESRWF